MFLDRLLDRVKEEKGITFEEFKGFCQFLNNLEDFAIAMKMYTLADHPISKGALDFHTFYICRYREVCYFMEERLRPQRPSIWIMCIFPMLSYANKIQDVA